MSEGVDHVRDGYNFPILRVKYAKDYRITYLRKDNITAILGVSRKCGKDIEYERFDIIAMKKRNIFEEIQAFKNNQLPITAQHYQVVKVLQNFYEKLNSQSKKLK